MTSKAASPYERCDNYSPHHADGASLFSCRNRESFLRAIAVAVIISNKGSQSTARQTKAVVLDSEIGQLPALTWFLRLSGLPIARVRIGRGHMDRADRAEPTVPLAAVPLPTRFQGARDGPPAPIAARSGSEDRTAGGAL